ncbi:MAG TPA: dihydrolipoyl dehydrogenase [Chloroflexota bacterium]|nr:dihydrolipoyl dehydrogenase [Chloroflexota bacterium]
MEQLFDVLVIGAGPGGYAAAIRAAQLGLTCAVVEAEELGGVCLNVGCIPSKAMLHSAEVLRLARGAPAFGARTSSVEPDFPAAAQHRDRAVAQLRQGLTRLLDANHVQVIHGHARLDGAHTCIVSGEPVPRRVRFEHLIIATGSRPARVNIPGADLPNVVDSTGALALSEAPSRAVIIGAGAVGVEWAEVWNAFGTDVTVLEMLSRVVPTEDADVSRELRRAFERKGIACHTGARVLNICQAQNGVEARALIEGTERAFSADVVLVAVGRKPNVDGLGLSDAGVAYEPKGIPTDGQMRTNVPHIFAIGDVTGGSQLAHVATHQGFIAAETIAGNGGHSFDPRAVPSAIFTQPEIASVGLHEADIGDGWEVDVHRFPFLASGRAVATGETTGFVKVLADRNTHEVLGVQIVGERAGDLIAEAALAVRLRATLDDLAATIHVHPTYSEAMLEASLVGLGTPLHVPPRPVRAQRRANEGAGR